jgi:hypothetical protein
VLFVEQLDRPLGGRGEPRRGLGARGAEGLELVALPGDRRLVLPLGVVVVPLPGMTGNDCNRFNDFSAENPGESRLRHGGEMTFGGAATHPNNPVEGVRRNEVHFE